jgi:cell division protein FtsI (penicillin-binding protein 3)
MKNEVLKRLYLVFAGFILLALVIIWKVFNIGILEGEKWRKEGDNRYVKFKDIEAERGNIIASDGSLLATSLPYFEIRMDLNAEGLVDSVFKKGIDSLALNLSKHIDRSKSADQWKKELSNARKKRQRYFLIHKDVNYEELMLLKTFPILRRGQHKGGLIVMKHSRRERPFKMMANRTIGLYRSDAPSIGLEQAYDHVLKGETGKQLMENVGQGVWIPVNDLTDIKPKSGKDIVTTLDINIQDLAQQALYDAMTKHQAAFGTVIVMEVKTGAIKALANLGKVGNDYWEDFNYGVATATEPGSTFKLPVLMAMLEDKKYTLEDSVDLNHGAERIFYGLRMKDAKPHRFKNATVQETFEISSNVGIALLADRAYSPNKGGTQFIDRLKQFRVNEPTGIDLEGEAKPYIKNAYDKKQRWGKSTIPWMAHGYECLMTPLQILTFYNAVANNGTMVKPYLVQEIQTIGEPVMKFGPTILRNKIASDSTIAQARRALEGVALRGTAKSHQTELYTFAGKTGTAVIDYATPNRVARKKYQASFVGYFPADNPVYSCIVVINDPSGAEFYGSLVSTPIFRAVADRIYQTDPAFHKILNTGIQPVFAMNDLPAQGAGYKDELIKVFDFFGLRIRKESNGQWAMIQAAGESLSLQNRPVEKEHIPDVRGMGLRDAVYVLENQGLKVHVSGLGKVQSQSLPPGTKPTGQTIDLMLN